ncbi:Nitrate reductase [Hirsutella minnesotensis 3608]|nr:Nitrate reductase [Hirsutella minnesotensis 3608]
MAQQISTESVASKGSNVLPPSPPHTAKPSRRGSVDDACAAVIVAPPSPSPEVLYSMSSAYSLPPPLSSTSVLPEDLQTPDHHVPRDSRLIRLTGVHPFNVEAPLKDLYDEGFLTSENLHYVRNHGHVPQCDDNNMDDWTFSVEGMVAHPYTLSLKDLIETFEQVTYPVTLVCAGNRRKEQNIVRKSKGFSWGPAGLSTALWTGTAICELLARAKPLRGAKYVCFEGADKLPNGHYGTSVKLNWCMDVQKGIMVAHKMNGRILHPDHGKPVRVVIPGQIGGRSVKWLKRIIVSSEPSDNWYHIYDNRVLPTEVTPEASANLPDVWKDERYAIYDLNANSAICYPTHDEWVSTVDESSSYKVQGYAYGGGGKRITRMEVTLDKGKSWRLANIQYPEDRYRAASEDETLYGGKLDVWWRDTSFCWCFWDLDFKLTELGAADDIMIRAMDEGLMVQPRDMYWSVLGMMNNPWFRVVIHKEEGGLRFEHPTQPALKPGGWMERVKRAGGNLSNGFWGEKGADEQDGELSTPEPEKEICMTKDKVDRLITLDELREHKSDANPWFVLKGNVYDGTPFLAAHPGGAASIVGAAGQDATEEFMAIHSENAKAMMLDYHIGRLDEDCLAALNGSVQECDPNRPVFLEQSKWTKAILVDKIKASSDSKIFRFRLDHEDQVIGLPAGQHVMMRLRDPSSREVIIRAYTPLSDGSDSGFMNVLVKIYHPTANRPGGKMTSALDAIPLGHFVDFKGPIGKFQYLGGGLCSVYGKQRRVRRFYMICAGSGITPMFQVLRAIAKDENESSECILLDGNRTEEDILCRSDLDDLKDLIRPDDWLRHTLTQPSQSWAGRIGRMDQAMIEAEIGACEEPGKDMILICGPERLEKNVHEILTRTGWTEGDVVFF